MMNQTEALTPLQNKALTHIRALGKIRFQGMFLSRASQQWNQRLGEITRRNEAEVLRSNSPTQIAKIMANLEKEYFKIINEALQSIPLDEPVKNKKNRLDTLSLLEEALIDMNFSFADNAQEIIQDGLQHHPENDLWVKLNKINDHISDWDQELELNEDSKLKVQAMIQTQKNIILLSMIKCIEHEKGRELINELSSHLDDQHKIHIAVAFSAITADGIEISPTNTSAFVSDNLEEPPRSISEYDTQPLLLKPSSNTNVIGSGSIFQIPIETDEDYQLDETLKDENVVENILKKTMYGTIYFNESGANYAPYQVTITHEMIHVLHNCQGLNARPLDLISADKNQWGSYEEYLTILGGSINESHFLTEYGAKARVTHVALGSETLFQPEGRKEVRSLNDIRPKSVSKSEPSTVERFHSYKDRFSSVKPEKNNAEIVQEKEIVPTFKKT